MRLSGERYETIKGTIADFFEDYDIKTTPIDVLEIARKNEYCCCIFVVFNKKTPKKDRRISTTCFSEFFCLF